MNLPFTQQQFFDVFAAYNTAVWPAPYALGALAIDMVVLVFRRRVDLLYRHLMTKGTT
jgi:hypothetical protein